MEDLSMDLKRRVVQLRESGDSSADVAERLMVSRRSVQRIWKHWKERGELSPSRRKGKGETRLVGQEQSLREWVGQRPEITLEELAERLLQRGQLKASRSTIWRKLQALGLRHKKKRLSRPSRTALTSPSDGRSGSSGKAAGTPRSWCS